MFYSQCDLCLLNIVQMFNFLINRIDILVNISIGRFMHAYTFLLFLSALWQSIGEVVVRQKLSLLHLSKFFVVRKVCRPVVGFCLYSCLLWWVQKWPKRVPTFGKFWRLSSGTVDDLLDGIFTIRGIVYCSKRYMSRPCCLLGMLKHSIYTCILYTLLMYSRI